MTTAKCPICGRATDAPAQPAAPGGAVKLPPNFPFCSKRCRLLDLGRWFDGHYRIPGAPLEVAEDGPAPPTGARPGQGTEGT
ncbi:MAG TPA: DNA gyrase inhibitor YacG [Planctomycetota bacterium]|nr:DNA gyrase inhibitor YacG [Planctomycetota bacterium]